MQLIFERGQREAPRGHALIYFQGDDGSILATYVAVPPIKFDLSQFVPAFLKDALQGMDLAEGMVGTPIPPIPEAMPSLDYLHALADRREDDLVFAGGTYHSDPMRMAAEAAEAAREYGELYAGTAGVEPVHVPTPLSDPDLSRFSDMTEGEQLNELTSLTGRMRDSVNAGSPDPDIERQMEALARLLPAKYRAERLVEVARSSGGNSQRLAELYLERSYKLFNEDYLDLERIDREIDSLAE
jgi:hypothetical protein